MKIIWPMILAVYFLGFLANPQFGVAAENPPDGRAAAILAIPHLRCGVGAQVNCGDGSLAMALARGGFQVMHGLTADPKATEQVNRTALAAGLAGRVSFAVQYGARLPYADDLLNLLVVDDYPALRQRGVSLPEILRVVAPFNTVVFGGVTDQAALGRELAQAGYPANALHQQGHWLWLVKPLPSVMDEWPQRWRDAGHSKVSHDQVVGPATGLRWIQGPIWNGTLGQEILAANGRTFYVEKNGEDKHCAMLVARDAFNGQELWTRPITLCKGETTESAAACGEQVFTRSKEDGRLVGLNAADGKVLWSSRYDGSFSCSDGLVIVRAARNRWTALNPATGAEERSFEVADSYHDVEALAVGDRFITLEADPAESADQQHQSDPAWRETLFKQAGPARGALVCFDVYTGTIRWKSPNIGHGWPYWLCRDLLMTRGQDGKMNVFAVQDGAYRWSQTVGTKLHGFTAAFYMKDAIWGYQEKSWYQAYDPATGQVRQVDHGRWKEFGRCGGDLATERFILGQEMQLTDLTANRTFDQFFTRGDCETSYIPAYGLLYNHGHTCSCTSYIRGIQAVSCVPAPKAETVGEPLLEKGSAYGLSLPDAETTKPTDDWPTYRHDPLRSGSCRTPVTAAVSPRWTTALASPITAPTVANGTVYLACSDQHRVAALDARDGKLIWDYFAGGRIDTPPTVYRGLVLFGGRDGWVYALRAADGYLAWRVRLAPEDRFICVRGRLESAWPVFGAVLVEEGVLWAAAGLHGDADGGVWAATIDPATGRVLWRENLHGFPPYRNQSDTRLIEARGKIPDDASEKAMAAADPKLVAGMGNEFANDVLIGNGKTVFLGGLGIDAATHQAGPPVGKAIFTHGVGLPTDTMLPSVYWNRLSWVYCGKDDQPAWMSAKQKTDALGNLLCLAGDAVYALSFPNRISAQQTGGRAHWSVSLDGKGLVARAFLVAGDRVVVACRVDGPSSSPIGELRVLSALDGHELGRTKLPAPPRFDGLAVGSGLLVASLEDGQVVGFPVQPGAAAPPEIMVQNKAASQPALRPIAVVLPTDDSRQKLLSAAKLPLEPAADVITALSESKYAVVVADADPAALKRLAEAPGVLESFTARGGWLVLWGLQPEGLAAFNRLVGVEHLLRPFELEKVSLVDGPRLLEGLTEADVALDGPESFGYAGRHYPALDAWYGAVDYDEIAPFCTLPGPEYWGQPNAQPKSDRWPRNLVNGFTDDWWRLQFVFSPDKSLHTRIPLHLPRRETVVGLGLYPGPYGQVRRIRLVSDLPGATPAEINLTNTPGRQDFSVPPIPADNITVEITDWDPSIKPPIIGIANLWLRVQRSEDFRRRVQPLLNPALLVAYPRGAGGIVLNQVRPLTAVDLEARTAKNDEPAKIIRRTEEKKRALVTHLLSNLAQPPGP